MPEIRLRGGEVDGLGLHYVVEGRGPAVVLVHGLGGFAESWRHNVAPLTRQATVYALDLPGFGTSAKPRAHYRLAYFALALHGFFEALGLRQASLVGHSLASHARRPARAHRRRRPRLLVPSLVDLPVPRAPGRRRCALAPGLGGPLQGGAGALLPSPRARGSGLLRGPRLRGADHVRRAPRVRGDAPPRAPGLRGAPRRLPARARHARSADPPDPRPAGSRGAGLALRRGRRGVGSHRLR